MRKQRNIVRYVTGLILALVASAGAAFSQAPNTWTAIGPSSGYVNSFAIDPANPNVMYVGTYYGVFKTTDGGASWKNSSLPPTHAIAVDPVNPNNVYAGTNPGGSCSGKYPLFKSIDAGATWSNATSPPDCDISVIVLNPYAPTTIFAQSTILWEVNGDPVGLWKRVLESNKQAFATEFVQRSRFVSAYPTSMSSEQFVDALFANAGVTPSASDRTAVLNEFAFTATTGDVAARSRALRRVAENSTLAQQEFSRAFVLMQYFGYLRRNPNDPPELTLDFQGYDFWLTKLTQFNGDYIGAEMVKAFLVSTEYRQRFGP
jgi:hypothetical protein